MFVLNPDADAAHNLAAMFLSQQDYDQAKMYLEKSIELGQDSEELADMYYELATLNYSHYKEYQTARTLARKAIELRPNWGNPHLLIGQLYVAAREEVFRLTAASPILMGKFVISRFGTGALYDLMDARRMMPTENYLKTQFDQASKLNAHAFKKKFKPKNRGCRGCHILCKKITKDRTSIPEFETMSHFSALLGNTDIDTVIKANRICNEMGMDTISAAATLACFSEISKKKLTPKEIVSLLTDIGKKKGVGSR